MPSPPSLTVGFVQYRILTGEPEKNASRLFNHIAKLFPRKPDLVLLPEIFLGGPPKASERPRYARLHREALARLKRLAAATGICFYGSLLEEAAPGRFYNTAIFLDAKGRIRHRYRKQHLFRFDNEHKLFRAGKPEGTFPTPWGRAAPLICYDLRFPEQLRRLTLENGAELALICAQWPAGRREHWLSLLKARAIENQLFVIACNRTGEKNGLSFAGDSCVISPWGEILTRLSAGRQTGVAVVDPARVAEVRRRYPFLRDAAR